MAKDTRILNITRGFRLKRNQAIKAVESCACAWVEFGVSVRDLTLAEAIAARNRRAAMRSPLPLEELPGCVYKPAPGKEAAARAEHLWAIAANQFAAVQAA